MAVQPEVGLLDYSSWNVKSEAYFSAVRTEIYGDLAPIQILFRQALPGAV